MMNKFESACVDCGFSCEKETCPYYRVENVYCDECNCSITNEEIYKKDGYDLCKDCMRKKVEEEKEYLFGLFKEEIIDEFMNDFSEELGYEKGCGSW